MASSWSNRVALTLALVRANGREGITSKALAQKARDGGWSDRGKVQRTLRALAQVGLVRVGADGVYVPLPPAHNEDHLIAMAEGLLKGARKDPDTRRRISAIDRIRTADGWAADRPSP